MILLRLLDRGYKVIKYNSLAHLYYGITSKFIITNTGPYKALEYRKSQVIINTWHGGGAYKKTGRDNPYKDKYKRLYNEKFGQSGVKLFLSSSKAFTKYAIMADSEINVLDKYIEKEALHAMMAVLTKKQRNLIYQNYVLDKTHQEIADGMGIARGSVTRSVNQALERIRRKFDFEAHYELAVGDFT